MKPPAVGSVWVRKTGVLNTSGQVPVKVLATDAVTVVATDGRGLPGRVAHNLEAFRFHYEPAPDGTPEPVVWPPEARPTDGAQITRLGEVPVGWLYREGWEPEDEWKVRTDDDRSYEGALVECRPPDGRDLIFDQPDPEAGS